MLKQMSRELAELKRENKLNLVSTQLVQSKWVSFAKNLLDYRQHELVEEQFNMKALKSTSLNYDSYIKPYQDEEKVKLEDQVRELNVLLNSASSDQARKEIQDAITFAEVMQKSLMKIHGDK